MKRIDGLEFPSPDNLVSVREARSDYIEVVLPARVTEGLTADWRGDRLSWCGSVALAEPKGYWLVAFRHSKEKA